MSRSAVAPGLMALLLLSGGTAFSAGQAPLQDAYVNRFLNKPAPPFSLKDLKGKQVKLADYKGKVVLLNFWYSTCFPCRLETPDLITLYRIRRGQGLEILGLNTDPIVMPEDRGSMLQKFLGAFPIPYPVLMADRKVYEDYGRIPIAPITLLVDRQGTIARVFWGATRGPVLDSALRPYLAKPARASGTSARGKGSGP